VRFGGLGRRGAGVVRRGGELVGGLAGVEEETKGATVFVLLRSSQWPGRLKTLTTHRFHPVARLGDDGDEGTRPS
jgi:hypothetical protein